MMRGVVPVYMLAASCISLQVCMDGAKSFRLPCITLHQPLPTPTILGDLLASWAFGGVGYDLLWSPVASIAPPPA